MEIKWPDRNPTNDFCCISMVRDEESFLHQWISHYTRELKDVSFFVIDHASSVPVREIVRANYPNVPISVISIPDIPFDDEYKSGALTALAGIALGMCRVVIASDVDELVIPLNVNEKSSLAELIFAEAENYIAPIGFEFVQNASVEGELDFREPLLKQRRFGRFHSAYSKPVIWKSNTTSFGAGQHRVFDKYVFSQRLCLAHLKYVDINLARKRQKIRNSIEFSESQIAKNRTAAWTGPAEEQWARGVFASVDNCASGEQAAEAYRTFRELLEARLDNNGVPLKGGAAHNLKTISKSVVFDDILL